MLSRRGGQASRPSSAFIFSSVTIVSLFFIPSFNFFKIKCLVNLGTWTSCFWIVELFKKVLLLPLVRLLISS